jgi:hypothetical protein
VVAALAWLGLIGGCDAAGGGDCPAGTTDRDPYCVPERFGDPCDNDHDDFLDDVCGGDDCNAADPLVHPRAVDDCNGHDDDCDGATDEDAAPREWYRDEDGDGWGGGAAEVGPCTPPVGAVDRGGDCADGDRDRHPGAEERCNLEDDDCDGFTDEGLVTRWYRDEDGDGFGTPHDLADGCALPSGFVPAAGDCDDANGDVRPDQLGYFEAAGGPAGFDYDCDGWETRLFDTVVGDCGDCTTSISGWAGEVAPGCGETGIWLTCRWDAGSGCTEQSRMPDEVQSCR